MTDNKATVELPSDEILIEMVNVDILPFFDDYDSEQYVFEAKLRAVEVSDRDVANVFFSLNNGEILPIPAEYFLHPVIWKETVINRLNQRF